MQIRVYIPIQKIPKGLVLYVRVAIQDSHAGMFPKRYADPYKIRKRVYICMFPKRYALTVQDSFANG